MAELGFGAWKRLSRLRKSDPARVADMADLVATEERTRHTVQQAAPETRKAINATYPEVETPVRIMPAARAAQKAEAEMVAEVAPKQVGHIADIGRARQQQALRLLIKARRVLESSPEGVEEVRAILDQAEKLRGISFRDAQKLYSSLGRAAAKGSGWKLAGEQIRALTDARDALESSMRDTLRFESQMARAAKAAGVMPEGELGDHFRFRDSQTGGSFSVPKREYYPGGLSDEAARHRASFDPNQQFDPLAAQKKADVQQRFSQWQPADKEAAWDLAQAKHRKFIEDFYKPDGALTKIMDAKPDERGEVLKHLLAEPKTRIRATEALERYGFNTKEILRLAEKRRDPVELNRAIQDAARPE